MRGTFPCSILFLGLLSFLGSLGTDGARGQPPLGKPPQSIAYYGDGFALLQHGNVLHGFVKPHADRVTIVLEKGNEVTVPNRQILTITKTMEGLYLYQVRAIRRWGSGEHWHLAHWCIQNGLLDQAIEHYSELEKTAAGSPKFKQLDLQLRQALLADSKVQQVLAESGIPNPIAPVTYEDPGQPESPFESNRGASDVATASFESRSSQSLSTGRIVPGYLRRSFQTDVLPIVISRCGQSGCHGMLSKNDFQVFQPVGEQAASIMQRDLDALMVYIDNKEPMLTSFLQYAIRPHGMQRSASINPNREEDRALIEKVGKWLNTLAESESAGGAGSHLMGGIAPAGGTSDSNRVSPAIALIPKSSVQGARQRPPVDGSPEQDRHAKLSKPTKSAPSPVVLNAAELQEIEAAIQKLEKIEANSRAARDPFDPAEFNSKYADKSDSRAKK
jgi:hypothetical protein